ncbi:MAG TPA: diguanylate cyclase [Leptolyngbyaceae cyanobacterium]
MSHTIDVLTTIQILKSNLTRLEISLDNYLDSSDVGQFAEYKIAVNSSKRQIVHIKDLTKDNPEQQANIQQLENIFNREINVQTRGINQGTLSDNALSSMMHVHHSLDRIEEVEDKLLDERRIRNNREGAIANGIAVIAISYAGIMVTHATFAQWRQKKTQDLLDERLKNIEMEQQLSTSLMACRNLDEGRELIKAFLEQVLPGAKGVIFEINNSRDQMNVSISFGGDSSDISLRQSWHSPHECWALRQGSDRVSDRETLLIPCQLCKKLNPEDQKGLMCLPLQAHEQTLGTVHITGVPTHLQPLLSGLTHLVALPLAVLNLQSELEYLSLHDPNTGLYNRRFLDEMVQRTAATADRYNRQPGAEGSYSVSFIFMDVDHFKRFNTQYGHSAGDDVLRALARLLMDNTRHGIDVVCRYGGEEFVLIMPNCNHEDALKKAESLRQKVKGLRVIDGTTITISMGVATYPEQGSVADKVLKLANAAMLQAKAEGRDRVCKPC